MESISSIILAAGQGKRMKSSLPKTLHCLMGKPMLFRTLDLVKSLGIKKNIIVIGHQAKRIEEALKKSHYSYSTIYQEDQLGTGHAVQQTWSEFSEFSGNVLILSADVPLLKASTITKMIHYHQKNHPSCTLLTARLDNPHGYGRIIRNESGLITGIIEQTDLSDEQESLKEINSGIYCFDSREMFAALQQVNCHNAQGEYYLPDVIQILLKKGCPVESLMTDDFREITGVNTRAELAEVSQILNQRNLSYHMSNGVTIVDPNNTWIDQEVKIGQDTVIAPFCIIESHTTIGQNCYIGPYSHLNKANIGNETKIHFSVIEDSQIGGHVVIGPYAHIRPDTTIKDEVKIGNFVEVKKSVIGEGTKASHLTYLGDAIIGKKVNIGAGTITCNYDGEKKNQTIIKDGVFIGSNNSLVAPVTIGRNSYTAAGSTITENVPENSLGIARGRQKNITGWVKKEIREKQKNDR